MQKGVSPDMNHCLFGFNGERTDPVSGHCHLGNGYRAYSPALMRFTCPDSLSPFGAGGINPYAYCAGDPVNHADPTGHLSWQAWLGIGMGIIGLGLAVLTGGAAIAAAGGVMAAVESASAVSLAVGATGVVSDVTAIASGAAEESHPQASAILGWVSLGTGAVGLAHGVYSAGRAVYQNLDKFASRMPVMSTSVDYHSTEWGLGEFTPLSAPEIGGSKTKLNAAFAFIDEAAPGSRRLNICGHGSKSECGIKFYHPDGTTFYVEASKILDEIESQGVSLSNISSIRLASCHGAENGLAQTLSDITYLPVQGFYGKVHFDFPKGFYNHIVDAININKNELQRMIDNGQTLNRIRTEDYYYFYVRQGNFLSKGQIKNNFPAWFFPQQL
ncbi:RHS repeat-associated core domain-containing protein [Enterobacteriaceae bacterium BIT-l23]|uniref:RHS repeat-associated core domain-containing protein n=1 Tax=Jejubacter sp. L23 TaxID=3092086 RepID=UPI001585989C|nr:RHS repeat-associated core domain-containing protein [Enterobacteriaceae bacterium BIT-l23]